MFGRFIVILNKVFVWDLPFVIVWVDTHFLIKSAESKAVRKSVEDIVNASHR